MTIYTDNGASIGNRTRLFRETGTGHIEWTFAVDYAGNFNRWYGFGIGQDSIKEMNQRGMNLTEFNV